MIIDVHGHWGPWPFSMDVASAEVNDELCARYGIDIQLVSSSYAVIVDAVEGNAMLDRVLAAHPRLRGLVVLDPHDPHATARELEKYIYPGSSWVGAKFHEDYSRTAVDSAEAHTVFRLVAQAGVPLLSHTWDRSVLALADACARIDGLRAVAGHMGGSGWRLAPEAAQRSPRIFFEPSYSIAQSGRYRWVADRIPLRQLMFGTDATLIDPAVAFGSILSADLRPDEIEHILWMNAAREFGLGEAVQTPAHGREEE